jgi:hypothetical protein
VDPSRAAEIRAAWFETADGTRVTDVPLGEPLTLCQEVAFHADLERPRFHFHLRNESHHTVFATSTELHPIDTGAFRGGECAVVRVRIEANWLTPGRYFLSPTVAALDGGPDALDVRMNLSDVRVTGRRHFDTVVELPHHIDIERLP